MQAPGLLKQRSYFLLRRLLAFLDPFVETASFAFLFAFLVPFVETYAFGMFSAFGPSPVADDPERISLELSFRIGLLAELPLLKPSLPLARKFKLQVLFCSNFTVSKWDQQLRSRLDRHTPRSQSRGTVQRHSFQRMTTYTLEI